MLDKATAAICAAAMFAIAAKSDTDTTTDEKILSEVFNRIVSDHVTEPDPATLRGKTIEEMFETLDQHSSYLDRDDYGKTREQISGRFGGLGIEVRWDEENNAVLVVTPRDDTPAYRADIRAGDIITHVNGEAVANMDTGNAAKKLKAAVNKMRGTVGTSITLTVERTGEREPLQKELVRDLIIIEPVKHAIIDNDIGYIRVTGFNEYADRRLDEAIEDIRAQLGDDNIRGYILDLRNNPGGLLKQSVEVADTFLDSGNIVSSRGTYGMQTFYANRGDLTNGKPLIVLINGGSASASEIVAGALKDNGRAKIMGTPTFGKGSVQTISPLPNGGATRLTTAFYYRPNGRSTQEDGVRPDIRYLPPVGGSQYYRREADLPRTLPNPGRGLADRMAAQSCTARAVAPEDAPPIDEDVLNRDGQPDYELLCAIEELRNSHIYTIIQPLPAPPPHG